MRRVRRLNHCAVGRGESFTMYNARIRVDFKHSQDRGGKGRRSEEKGEGENKKQPVVRAARKVDWRR